MDDQNLILRTVIRDDYKLEDLILSQHALTENFRKGWVHMFVPKMFMGSILYFKDLI